VAQLILLLATTAFGADFSGQEDPVTPEFSVYGADFPSDAGGPSGLVSAVSFATRTWNVQGDAAVELRHATAAGGGDLGGADGLSTIDVGTGTGTAPYLVFPVDVGDDRSSCDIRLLTSNDSGPVAWTTGATGVPDTYDTETVLLQALGSCLGLAPSAGDSVMAPLSAGVADRDLGADDPAALAALYGPAAIVLTPWSHFVIYDPGGGDDADGRGEPGEEVLFRLQVRNEGTAAYGVSGHAVIDFTNASLSFTLADATHGDIAPGEFAVFAFTMRIDDCEPGTTDVQARVDLTDERGDVYPIDVDFPLQCGGGPDTGTDDEPKCNCATGPSGGWLAIFAAASLFRRRRSR